MSKSGATTTATKLGISAHHSDTGEPFDTRHAHARHQRPRGTGRDLATRNVANSERVEHGTLRPSIMHKNSEARSIALSWDRRESPAPHHHHAQTRWKKIPGVAETRGIPVLATVTINPYAYNRLGNYIETTRCNPFYHGRAVRNEAAPYMVRARFLLLEAVFTTVFLPAAKLETTTCGRVLSPGSGLQPLISHCVTGCPSAKKSGAKKNTTSPGAAEGGCSPPPGTGAGEPSHL